MTSLLRDSHNHSIAVQIFPLLDRSSNELPYRKKLQVHNLTTLAYYGKPFLSKDRYNST